MSYKLEDWAIYSGHLMDPYRPPEAAGIRLEGIVTGHPRHDDGKRVITSRVLSASGRLVKTNSGSEYELGTVSPGYSKWCAVKGIIIDPKNPVRIVFNDNV